MITRRPIEATLEVRKDDVGSAKLFLDQRERHCCIGDIHQVYVTGKDHLRRHRAILASLSRGDDNRAGGEVPPASGSDYSPGSLGVSFHAGRSRIAPR